MHFNRASLRFGQTTLIVSNDAETDRNPISEINYDIFEKVKGIA